MKITKLAAGILLGVLTAYACGGKSTQAGGSNTNWFATCESSSECSAGLECWCGICTKTCTDDCSPAGATCSAPPPSCAALAASNEAEKEHACTVQCTKDADCKDVGANAICVLSICRHPAATSEGLTCDQLNTQAQNALQPLRDGADESCQNDADCIAFPDLSCTPGCPTVTISKNGLAAIQGQIDAIDKDVCTPSAHGVCFIHSCPYTGAPGCVHGQCQNVFPNSAQPDAGTCDTEADHIYNTLLDALDALDKSCRVDADCTRVQPDLSCEGGCSVDASTTAATAFAAMRASYESNLCASYNAQGCRPVFSGCPATPVDAPKCLNNLCIDVFTTTTDPAAGASCADRNDAMLRRAQSTAGAVDKKCMVDADCVSVPLINACLRSCTYVPASTRGAAALGAELDALEVEECSWFTQAGCTAERTPCPTGGAARCNAGTCSVQ